MAVMHQLYTYLWWFQLPSSLEWSALSCSHRHTHTN